MAVDHLLQNFPEIRVGLDIIELRGLDEGGDGGPTCPAAVGAGEEMVLPAERNGSDRSLDGIVVELDPAVLEEPAKSVPAGERIADRLGEAAAGGEPRQLFCKPELQCLDERA